MGIWRDRYVRLQESDSCTDFGIPGKTDPNSGFTRTFGCSCSTPDTSNPVLGSGGPRHIQIGLKLGF
jgi:hypothetical protein